MVTPARPPRRYVRKHCSVRAEGKGNRGNERSGAWDRLPHRCHTAAMSVAISLRGLRKNFGAVAAVDGVDLDIADGEFFSMLGPSGSGKTTVLRMVAGFESPDRGPDPPRRPGRHLAAAVRPRRQHGLPGLRAVPAHERAGERRLRAAGEEGRPASSAGPAPRRRSRRSGWAASATAGRTSSPAASGSAWRSRGRWSTGRRCCSSTSRSAPSTSSCAARCRSSSRRCSARSASPSCS